MAVGRIVDEILAGQLYDAAHRDDVTRVRELVIKAAGPARHEIGLREQILDDVKVRQDEVRPDEKTGADAPVPLVDPADAPLGAGELGPPLRDVEKGRVRADDPFEIGDCD